VGVEDIHTAFVFQFQQRNKILQQIEEKSQAPNVRKESWTL